MRDEDDWVARYTAARRGGYGPVNARKVAITGKPTPRREEPAKLQSKARPKNPVVNRQLPEKAPRPGDTWYRDGERFECFDADHRTVRGWLVPRYGEGSFVLIPLANFLEHSSRWRLKDRLSTQDRNN